jgi:hypothetical protein
MNGVRLALSPVGSQQRRARIDSSGERLLIKTITGMADCWARAASGHATAPPLQKAKPAVVFSALLTQWGPQRERALAGFGRKSWI